MRLDKLLANMGFGSRKDVKAILKKKQVTVNNTVVRDGSTHIDPEADRIEVNHEQVHYEKYIYIMMNKPKGVISATVDDRDKTVIDLLESDLQIYKPFPVGRLDKDTEGLMFITNDGELAHQLVSPRKNIAKTYYAEIEGRITEADIEAFSAGVILDDGYQSKPAKLTILNRGEISKIEVKLTEGKFHQVKRMFEAVGKKVIYLKRESMGELELDENLNLGAYRRLTEAELNYCLSLKK